MSFSPRPLNPIERDWTLRALRANDTASEKIYLRAVDRCLIYYETPSIKHIRGPRSLVAQIALYQRASGITLGTRVYVRQDMASYDGKLPIDLVVHELAHVVQFLRDGSTKFIAVYLKDYAKNLAQGMKDYDAYLNIPYEIEARRVEDYVINCSDS